MLKNFEVLEIKHVKREFNTLADKLSNDAIDFRGELIQQLVCSEEIQKLFSSNACIQKNINNDVISIDQEILSKNKKNDKNFSRQNIDGDDDVILIDQETQSHKKQNRGSQLLSQQEQEVVCIDQDEKTEKETNIENQGQKQKSKKRTFDEIQDEIVVVKFDGAARGNPGKAGCGATVEHQTSHQVLIQGFKFVGHKETNNEAEFKSLILGLELAKKIGAKKIVVQGDSELLIKGLKEEYKIKKKNLVPIFNQIKEMLKQFEVVDIKHVKREFNTLADKLSNDAIDYQSDRVQQIASDEEICKLIGKKEDSFQIQKKKRRLKQKKE
eukprot:TRINITY_DN43041_c0_g1_i2.p1 TRINITY_DN43041_c0_g1~~TRINITY_DN43041_c0_g1_i2.p1  ORF type:complete len:326 (-),score=62.14 TRINITY_DN43041_c0_g1_i2:199-1176(-)